MVVSLGKIGKSLGNSSLVLSVIGPVDGASEVEEIVVEVVEAVVVEVVEAVVVEVVEAVVVEVSTSSTKTGSFSVTAGIISCSQAE